MNSFFKILPVRKKKKPLLSYAKKSTDYAEGYERGYEQAQRDIGKTLRKGFSR